MINYSIFDGKMVARPDDKIKYKHTRHTAAGNSEGTLTNLVGYRLSVIGYRRRYGLFANISVLPIRQLLIGIGYRYRGIGRYGTSYRFITKLLYCNHMTQI